MKIQENATVKVIDGVYAGKVGQVVSVYEAIETALVSFEDGDVGKVGLGEMVEILPEECEEIPAGAKKIERKEFYAALKARVNELGGSDREAITAVVGSLTALVSGTSWIGSLYGDAEAIIIDKDALLDSLWRWARPDNMREIMPFDYNLEESLAAVKALGPVVNRLFPAA